jgi:hypothetical protein
MLPPASVSLGWPRAHRDPARARAEFAAGCGAGEGAEHRILGLVLRLT